MRQTARTFAAITIAVAALSSVSGTALAQKLLSDGQTIVASFSSGELKGQKFTLRYNESAGTLGNRRVLSHSASSISLKTPKGKCKFSSNGTASCHNGKGNWVLK